jgi:hypothetical protein
MAEAQLSIVSIDLGISLLVGVPGSRVLSDFYWPIKVFTGGGGFYKMITISLQALNEAIDDPSHVAIHSLSQKFEQNHSARYRNVGHEVCSTGSGPGYGAAAERP